jgi:hypothetical protein
MCVWVGARWVCECVLIRESIMWLLWLWLSGIILNSLTPIDSGIQTHHTMPSTASLHHTVHAIELAQSASHTSDEQRAIGHACPSRARSKDAMRCDAPPVMCRTVWPINGAEPESKCNGGGHHLSVWDQGGKTGGGWTHRCLVRQNCFDIVVPCIPWMLESVCVRVCRPGDR